MGGARLVLKQAWRSVGRALLAIAGLGLVAALVRSAGPGRVARVLWNARGWLPLLLALEMLQPLGDFVALRLLLGPRRSDVPMRTWLRSSAIAYSMMTLLPAGRGAGEIARASLIAKHVGGPRAAGVSIHLQSAYTFAIALFALTECAVVATTPGAGSALALLLAADAVVLAAVASGLLAALRHPRLEKWLERLSRPLRPAAPPIRFDVAEAAPGPLPAGATAICSLARAAQVVQYGVVLRAVGGAGGVRGALLAHGIHIVGSTVGDVLPNQMGIVDGAYRAFAGNIGLSEAPARALSIAFLVHIVQLIAAAGGILVAALGDRIGPPRSWRSTSPTTLDHKTSAR
ncbi:MAG TPA: lysylphosphatidylglycerol synthase domain-containing protein [Polyangiaceae bacterium]|nr:lysylphosphatidylglycerol synthase domain-containing protein [Polyangiaceae bacterium]